MGQRIGSLWKHEKDGKKYTTGKMSALAGINIPAGQEVTVAIVRNEKKTPDNNQPDAFIEIWENKEGGQ